MQKTLSNLPKLIKILRKLTGYVTVKKQACCNIGQKHASHTRSTLYAYLYLINCMMFWQPVIPYQAMKNQDNLLDLSLKHQNQFLQPSQTQESAATAKGMVIVTSGNDKEKNCKKDYMMQYIDQINCKWRLAHVLIRSINLNFVTMTYINQVPGLPITTCFLRCPTFQAICHVPSKTFYDM